MKKKKFTTKRHSSPLMPYKVMAILLYGYPTGMQKVKGTVVLSTPEFCKSIGIMRCRLLGHLEELDRLMMIHKLDVNGSMIKFDILTPEGYNKVEE